MYKLSLKCAEYWCSFYKYEFILIWWLLIILNHTESEFSSFINLITSYCCCIAALFTVFITIINDVILLTDYNYLLIKNVLSAINKLKITVKILCCWAEKLNINTFITLLMLLLCLCQLCFCLLLHYYSEW